MIAKRTSSWLASIRRRRTWDRFWKHPEESHSVWLGRPVDAEIEEAVAEGWFPAGEPVLELGCGDGTVASWLAARGFPVLGIDISPVAIERARKMHGGSSGQLEFQVLDICRKRPPGRFGVVLDRGCFHGVGVHDPERYARNVSDVCGAGAAFLLLMKAYRSTNDRVQDERVRERTARRVGEVFAPWFEIERVRSAPLDQCLGRNPELRCPGLVFRLRRL